MRQTLDQIGSAWVRWRSITFKHVPAVRLDYLPLVRRYRVTVGARSAYASSQRAALSHAALLLAPTP